LWSPGGSVKQFDGQEEIQLPTGLWFQLKSGYVNPYNIYGFDLGIIETGLQNYILGRRDYTNVGSEPSIELEYHKRYHPSSKQKHLVHDQKLKLQSFVKGSYQSLAYSSQGL